MFNSQKIRKIFHNMTVAGCRIRLIDFLTSRNRFKIKTNKQYCPVGPFLEKNAFRLLDPPANDPAKGQVAGVPQAFDSALAGLPCSQPCRSTAGKQTTSAKTTHENRRCHKTPGDDGRFLSGIDPGSGRGAPHGG